MPEVSTDTEPKKNSQKPSGSNNSVGPIKNSTWMGLAGGVVVFLLTILSSPPEGLSLEGWRTAGVALLMAIWWFSEAIPISATALVPLILFPVLGISDISATASPYANPMIFLFMGGFIIAIAMQEWGLHKRIALNIIGVIGSKPRSIIMGFMVSSAFMSMWVSNTAATLMMLPIALSVIQLTKITEHGKEEKAQYKNFGIALMLAVAFSSSVGGLGTVIGTPTNALLIGFIQESYGIEISFAQWMLLGVPVVVLGLPVIFYSLVNITFPVSIQTLPGGKEYIKDEMKRLGAISRPEVMVAAVFTLVAVLWMSRPVLESFVPGLSDAGISIFGAVLLFMIPVNVSKGVFLLNWKAAEKLPWGVLILFGGGLTLAGAIHHTGLAEWIGGYFAIMGGWPIILVIFVIVSVILIFTELASNSATAAAFLPIMGSVAIGVGQNPLLLAIPVAIVASCAFMLPVATPPNAIVYGSGVMTIPQMAKAGMILNLFFAMLVTVLTYFLFTAILGIEIGVVPDGLMP